MKYFFSIFIILFNSIIMMSCGVSGPQVPKKELNKPSIKTQNKDIVLYKDALPVFKSRCVTCHVKDHNFLGNFKEAKEKSNDILNRVKNKSMPMQNSQQALNITDQERQTIISWVNDGALEVAQDSVNIAKIESKELTIPLTKVEIQIQTCNGCHSNDESQEYPLLDSLNQDYIVQQLSNFAPKNQSKPLRYSPIMSPIAESLKTTLSDEEIKEVALYFSSKPRQKSVNMIKSNPYNNFVLFKQNLPITQEFANKTCSSCHYTGSNPNNNYIGPQLAGQKGLYLINQLMNFKTGDRINPIMNSMVQQLDEEQIEALGWFYSSLPPEQKTSK